MYSLSLSNIFIIMIMFFQLLYATLASFIRMDIGISMILSQLFCFALPSVIFLMLTRRSKLFLTRLKRISFTNIIYVVILSLSVQPLAMVLSAITSLIFPNNVTAVLADIQKTNTPPTMIFVVCIIPAVCEELALRGAAALDLEGINLFKAALLNGLYFAIIHLNFHQFFYALFLGMLLFIMLRLTQSIFAPMLAHFVINLSQSLRFINLQNKSLETGDGLAVAIMLISVPLFIVALMSFARNNNYTAPKEKAKVKVFDLSFVFMFLTYITIMFL